MLHGSSQHIDAVIPSPPEGSQRTWISVTLGCSRVPSSASFPTIRLTLGIFSHQQWYQTSRTSSSLVARQCIRLSCKLEFLAPYSLVNTTFSRQLLVMMAPTTRPNTLFPRRRGSRERCQLCTKGAESGRKTHSFHHLPGRGASLYKTLLNECYPLRRSMRNRCSPTGVSDMHAQPCLTTKPTRRLGSAGAMTTSTSTISEQVGWARIDPYLNPRELYYSE